MYFRSKTCICAAKNAVSRFAISRLNIHRLVITAVMLAVKFFDDVSRQPVALSLGSFLLRYVSARISLPLWAYSKTLAEICRVEYPCLALSSCSVMSSVQNVSIRV